MPPDKEVPKASHALDSPTQSLKVDVESPGVHWSTTPAPRADVKSYSGSPVGLAVGSPVGFAIDGAEVSETPLGAAVGGTLGALDGAGDGALVVGGSALVRRHSVGI